MRSPSESTQNEKKVGSQPIAGTVHTEIIVFRTCCSSNHEPLPHGKKKHSNRLSEFRKVAFDMESRCKSSSKMMRRNRR